MITVAPFQSRGEDERRRSILQNAVRNDKRLRDRDEKYIHRTRPLEDLWLAVDLILAGLPGIDGQYDSNFQAKLNNIRITFERETESSDSSPRVQELLRTSPPGLLSITNAVIKNTDIYIKGGLQGLSIIVFRRRPSVETMV